MPDPSRQPQWSDTMLMLLSVAVFFFPLGFIAWILFGSDRGSDGSLGESVAPEPLWPSWVLPATCAVGAVVSMTAAIRIVVRQRA